MTELFRQLRWLDPVFDIVRFGLFLGLVTVGLVVAWCDARPSSAGVRRRAVDRLLVYVVGVSVAVGLVQQESWPFTTWALVHNLSPKKAGSWEMIGSDSGGRAYPIDPSVLEPLSPEEFGAWMFANLRRLDPAARVSVARFILEKAEAGRVRLLNGGRVDRNEWLLGRFAAPYHFHTRMRWRSPADLPATPFTGLQVWMLEWDVEERLRDESRVTRTLLFEVHDPSS